MRDALAAALRDSTTRLLFQDAGSGAWRDARGRPVAWPPDLGPDQALTTIGDDDEHHDVALVHDVALLDDRELLDAVSGLVLVGVRDERLTAGLRTAMSDLQESRHRIAEAADLERARIERDLHDGAQQRLVALRIRLELAEDLLSTDPGAGLRLVRQLGPEAEARSRSCAPSRTASTRRCWPIGVWSTRCDRLRCRRRCPSM
jgi:signal transduction histidine kinase